jgi:hypothetical protein
MRGHFTPFPGGSLCSVLKLNQPRFEGGQFTPFLGGQFDRFLQVGHTACSSMTIPLTGMSNLKSRNSVRIGVSSSTMPIMP